MLSFPNCKINFGLYIINKRDDGFHNIETVFFPVPLTDIAEIIPSKNTGIDFTTSGIPVNNDNSNLCKKAYNLIKKDFPNLPPVKMHLHKVIPLGAGLGGGSADAAFTLQLLNDKFSLGLTKEQLINYALQTGSDCPFFIINKPCFATGRGEVIHPINLNLSAYKLVIINPGIHIDTKWAFAKIKPSQPEVSIKNIIAQPVETWKDQLKNDFEIPVFAEYPEIKNIKEGMYHKGAAYASLSGSGSTVYALLKKDKIIANPTNDYFFKVINLNN